MLRGGWELSMPARKLSQTTNSLQYPVILPYIMREDIHINKYIRHTIYYIMLEFWRKYVSLGVEQKKEKKGHLLLGKTILYDRSSYE